MTTKYKYDNTPVHCPPALKVEVKKAAKSLHISIAAFGKIALERLVDAVNRGEAVELRKGE